MFVVGESIVHHTMLISLHYGHVSLLTSLAVASAGALCAETRRNISFRCVRIHPDLTLLRFVHSADEVFQARWQSSGNHHFSHLFQPLQGTAHIFTAYAYVRTEP